MARIPSLNMPADADYLAHAARDADDNCFALARQKLAGFLSAPTPPGFSLSSTSDKLWPGSATVLIRPAILGDPEVVARVVEKAGLDASALLEAAGDAAVKAELRATTEEAVARGAFGAPTFFVGDEMFFGNDRLDFVERALVERSGS